MAWTRLDGNAPARTVDTGVDNEQAALDTFEFNHKYN